MSSLNRVLLIDDDPVFLNNLEFSLSRYFDILKSDNLDDAKKFTESTHIDAILLDYQIGSQTGHEFMDYLGVVALAIPVVVLSGCINLEMTVGFLKRRPYGFLEKPATFLEIKNTLEAAILSKAGQKPLDSLGFEIDYKTRKVSVDDKEIILTKTEFELLCLFIKNRKKQLSRMHISKHLWGNHTVSKNTLDTHLLNLKKKIPPFSNRIVSVYGNGYLFDA